MWSFNPSNAILARVEGFHLQSLQGLKDHVWSFNASKDYKCNPSKGWRITCSPSTLRRIAQSFEWLKDCTQSFSPSKDHIHNIWKGWMIPLIVLRRVEGLREILQPFQGLWMQSFGWRTARDHWTLRRTVWSFEGLKDWIHNPSEGQRIACNPSTL